MVQVRFFQNRANQRIAYLDDGNGPLVLLSSKEVREALIGLVRADGRLGARTLAAVFHPGGDAEERRRFNQIQRASAEPETAARLLELTYALDARPFVEHVRAPVLVLHRKDDLAVCHHQARTLCASLKDAALTTLPAPRTCPGSGTARASPTRSWRSSPAPAGARP